MTHQYDEFVKFANLLADESSIIITKYFRTKININKKGSDPGSNISYISIALTKYINSL